MGLGYAYARSGDIEGAYRVLELLDRRREAFPQEQLSLDYAILYIGMKQWDKALFHLRRSVNEKFILTIATILTDPVFDPLREDERFRQLIRRLAFPAATPAHVTESPADNPLVEIKADTKEQIRLLLNQLIYIKAEGNYSRIVYAEGSEIACKLVRLSLLDAAEQIRHAAIHHCHRSFLVNLNNFKAIRGNAKKYELVSPLMQRTIPVSRSKGKALQAHFQAAAS